MFDDLPSKPENWDPQPHERTYYRSRTDGQLAWLVVRNGRDMIKLDRFSEDLVRGFDPAEWIPEAEHRPMTRAQAAQVAYAAIMELRRLMGHFDRQTPWHSLSEEYRILFAEKGPQKPPPISKDVYFAIMGALERVMK